jgi:D-3-phosphoglycerate dehydrogenase
MSVVVCAGDEFISADLLARALADAGVEGEFRRIDTAWPTEPFGAMDGVREAAGDPARLAELVRGADALVTHLAPLTAEVLDAGKGTLRVVGVTRGGPVNVDLPAATAAGVLVAYLPGRNLGAVAEFCVGTMICAPPGRCRGARGRALGRRGLPLRAHRVGAARGHRRARRAGSGRAAGGRAAARLRLAGARARPVRVR